MTGKPNTLQALLDYRAIEAVLIKYCNALTEGDFDGVASCFAKDATFAGMSGRDGIRESFAHHYGTPLNGSMPVDFLKRGMYYLSNVEIDIQGDDTARAFSFGRSQLFGQRGEEVVLLVRGFTYTDDLVREDGEWVIKSRSHTFKWMYEATPLQETGTPQRVDS